MKLGKLIFGVFVLVVGLVATLVNAGEGERSLATIEESNNTRFETPWTEVKAGQSVTSGVALAKNGTLSVNGKPLQPAIKVTDSAGKAGAPSSVKISASSPSGRFALLIACEPVPSPDNLCWFQYLLDLERGQVLDAGWAKYPVPSHIWWSKEDTYAILPISDEGETWLTVLDLKKRESRDIHFFESLEKAGRSLPCKPNEEQTVIDLDSLAWIHGDQITLAIAMQCGNTTKSVMGAVTLSSGAITLAPTSASQKVGAAPAVAPGFDCSKASSPVEKMICGNENLSRLDAALLAAYKEAAKGAADSGALKKEQVAWLRQVRDKCPDDVCLANAYRQRMDELQNQQGSPLFPAQYKGGFTGDDEITFTNDGRILEGGVATGTYRKDSQSPWPDAKYPLLLVRDKEEEHCKIQPDMRKLICFTGGSLSAEYERQGAPPSAGLPAAKKCDEEQLYLDVMDAARKARPNLELKGASDIRLNKDGTCLINLYYLKNGQAIDQWATYERTRPVKLTLIKEP